jgi:hypothetical protein
MAFRKLNRVLETALPNRTSFRPGVAPILNLGLVVPRLSYQVYVPRKMFPLTPEVRVPQAKHHCFRHAHKSPPPKRVLKAS